jgi:hypothetical protein
MEIQGCGDFIVFADEITESCGAHATDEYGYGQVILRNLTDEEMNTLLNGGVVQYF